MGSTVSPTVTETGLQLFNRLHPRPSLEKLHSVFITGPKPNSIIQVTGATSTGKSLLICELIVHTILPKHISNECKECSAIFINTDHQISIIQIARMAENKLSNKNIPCEQQQIMLEAALARLTILNCHSFRQLEMTILNLEYLLIKNVNVSLVAIDSLSAYYWCERYASATILSINKHCVNLLKMMKTVIDGKQIVVVFTKYETDTSLIAMIDYTILLKCDKSKVQNSNYVMEYYDHGVQEKRVHPYVIKEMLIIEIG